MEIPKVVVNGKEVGGVELDLGYAIGMFDPNGQNNEWKLIGVQVNKEVFGCKLAIYLSKEEVQAIQEFIQKLN